MAIRTAADAEVLQRNIDTIALYTQQAALAVDRSDYVGAESTLVAARSILESTKTNLTYNDYAQALSKIDAAYLILRQAETPSAIKTAVYNAFLWMRDQKEWIYQRAVQPAVDEAVQTIRVAIAKYDSIDADIRSIESTYQQLRTLANAQNVTELKAQQMAAASEVGTLGFQLRQQLNQQTVKVETLRDLLRQAADARIISQNSTMGGITTTGAIVAGIFVAGGTVASIMFYLASVKSSEAKVRVQEIKASALRDYQEADAIVAAKIMALQDQINTLLGQPQSAQRDAQIAELRNQIAVLQGLRPKPIPDDFFKDGGVGADIPWGWIALLGGGAVAAYVFVNWMKSRAK